MFKQGLFITAELRIKPKSDLDTAIAAIHSFCDAMNSEQGCSMAVPLQDRHDPRRYIFWERYESQEAFDQHFHAEHTQAFIKSGLTELIQSFESKLLIEEK
jgi:quinol monooxygenase YgiN